MHYFDPHFSYVRRAKFGFADGYGGPLQSPIRVDDLHALEGDAEPRDVAFVSSVYDEEVAFTDEWIGELVRGVKTDSPGSARPSCSQPATTANTSWSATGSATDATSTKR